MIMDLKYFCTFYGGFDNCTKDRFNALATSRDITVKFVFLIRICFRHYRWAHVLQNGTRDQGLCADYDTS